MPELENQVVNYESLGQYLPEKDFCDHFLRSGDFSGTIMPSAPGQSDL